jgi:GAF domain-containing protein/nitrogen-specific signal transduction histidine kinase
MYFPKIPSETLRALITSDPPRSLRIDMMVNGNARPVLAEFGTIECNTYNGGYALLADLSEEVESEQKALEAAPYGMLKLDAKHRVVYANLKALELLEFSSEKLIGQDARRLVTDVASLKEVLRQSVQRRKGRGGQYDILFTTPVSRKHLHLRISSIPLFDVSGSVTGTLTALEQIDYEVARGDISRLIATETEYKKLFTGLMEVVKRFIGFEEATLSVRTAEGDYSLAICRYPESEERRYMRWFPVPEGFRRWLKQPQSWIDDLPSYLASTVEGRYLLQNPDVKRYVDEGARAVLAVPIYAGGQLIGSLSLLSKQPSQYSEGTKKTLERLALDQALLAVFNARERAEHEFISNLLKEISKASNHKILANTVVWRLTEFYRFQNVSIFKVNTLRGRFTVLAQALGPNGGHKIDEGYSQPLDQGLLGEALAIGQPKILKDVNEDSEEARAFVRVTPETTSELCIPIKMRGRVVWILNLEDPQSNAFTDKEVHTIQGIIGQIEETLERLFKSLVLDQVLEELPEAIAILDVNGKILECNKAALQMFERDSLVPGDNIAGFIYDAEFLAALSVGSYATHKITVEGSNGKRTPVLACKFTLPEEYDHVVLKLQDVTTLEWQTDLERLKVALAETVSQVRVPVSLVSTFIQQIGKNVKDSGLRELSEKAVRQLSRVELTYDRVLAACDPDELPPKRDDKVDLRSVLHRVLSELPALNRRSVKLHFCEGDVLVLADPYRVLFAVSSILTYLLRSRADASSIKIKVEKVKPTVSRPAMVAVSMSGPVPPVSPHGELESLVEETRTEIALGDSVLRRIAQECGGVFDRYREKNGRERLTLQIPAAHELLQSPSSPSLCN